MPELFVKTFKKRSEYESIRGYGPKDVEYEEVPMPQIGPDRRFMKLSDTSSLLVAAMLGKQYLCKYKEH